MTPTQLELQATAAAKLTSIDRACRDVLGDRLVQLADTRIRELIDPAAGPHQLADWPTSVDLTDLDRAALAFTEQFVIDASGMTDELVGALSAHLTSEEVYVFARAVQQAEARLRARLVLRHEPALADVVTALRSSEET